VLIENGQGQLELRPFGLEDAVVRVDVCGVGDTFNDSLVVVSGSDFEKGVSSFHSGVQKMGIIYFIPLTNQRELSTMLLC
jgi:hypothetical protein